MKYQVKELGVGGILDQAIALVKNRFGLLLGITMVMLVPYMIVAGLASQAMMPVLPPQPTADDMAEYQRQYIGALPILVPIGLLYFVVAMPLTSAAITFAVANEYLERPITVGGALRHALRIVLPFMGTGILFYLAIWGGTLLCFLPGVVFAFWFALWAQVVVIEGVKGIPALKRSKLLMKGNVGTLFVLGLIVAAIDFGISMIANLIPEPHVRAVVAAIVEGALFSFAGAAYVVFYFSSRCKAENFDLTLLADSVTAE